MGLAVLNFVTNSEQSIRDLVRQVRPEWRSEELVLRCYEGGLTNRLYGVRTKSAGIDRTLLVRVFGEGSDLLIDREREQKCIRYLNKCGLAAPLYATFTNGFVYGYLLGTPVKLERMRAADTYPNIARHLATFHCRATKPDDIAQQEPRILVNLREWIELVPEKFSKSESEAKAAKLIPNRAKLREEVRSLSAVLEAFDSPIVFCHCDTTAGNILCDDSHPEKVAFIDYEYCGWNYRCFELGNMFCEYCGADHMDFSLYPSKAEQLNFLAEYSEKVSSLGGRDSAADVDQLYREACLGALASNLQWGLWSLVQAEHSAIDFDYIVYANTRLTEYFKRKEEYLAIAHGCS